MTTLALPNVGITAAYLPGDDDWSTSMNRNLRLLDALIQAAAVDRTATPPGTPVNNRPYIVAASPSGAWAGQAQNIAIYQAGDDLSSAWLFVTPKEGWRMWVEDEDAYYQFDGSTWAIASSGGGGSSAPNVQGVTSAATVTPAFANDVVKITAQAAALTLANPTGTAVDSWAILLKIKDDGTARAITWGAQYRGMGEALRSTTVAGKWMFISMVWNVEDSKWDVMPAIVQP